MLFSRGMRDKLEKYVDINRPIDISISISGPSVYDFCCFGLDNEGKLSDDRYMVFYNQTSSPQNEILFHPGAGSARFSIRLFDLPQSIHRLLFTASIDGNGIMGKISKLSFSLSQNGGEAISMSLSGTDFREEKAVIAFEIYRKPEWRASAVASGFNGGPSALLASFGGTEIRKEANARNASVPTNNAIPSSHSGQPHMQGLADKAGDRPFAHNGQQPFVTKNTQAMQNAPSPHGGHSIPGNRYPSDVLVPSPHGGQPVSLKKTEKQLTNELMGKISLTKDKAKLEKHVVSLSKCVVNLSKNQKVDLGAIRAKVAVVLDYSGSMSQLYKSGTVQNTINRLVPLGLTFDDNGSIDVYLFQYDYRKISDLTLANYENYVEAVVRKSGYSMGGTNYAPVLTAIIEEAEEKAKSQTKKGLFGFGKPAAPASGMTDNGEPLFILFITDGGNADRRATNEIIKKSSEMNVFIQFIGIGNEKFEYLMRLDNMRGRNRDNTGFSKMLDLEKASDDELYSNVLSQFSDWLNHLQ